MAENGTPTPEQQLLKLIEGKGGAAPAGAAKPGGRSAAPSLAGLRGMLAGRLSFWKRSRGKSGKGSVLDLTALNRLLALTAAALLAYVTFDAAAAAMSLRTPPNISIVERKGAGGQNAPREVMPLKESSFYLERVEARDIFKEGPRERPQEPIVQQVATADTPAAASQFSLVGISWSADPDVIIENKAEARTYFVKRGQPVGGGVKVEAVFKDHVVLSRDGQEFEIR